MKMKTRTRNDLIVWQFERLLIVLEPEAERAHVVPYLCGEAVTCTLAQLEAALIVERDKRQGRTSA